MIMKKSQTKIIQSSQYFAIRKRNKAIKIFIVAVLVAIIPFGFDKVMELIQPLLSESLREKLNFEILKNLSIFLIFISIDLIIYGIFLWIGYYRLIRSNKGKIEIISEIDLLTQKGWKIEYTIEIPGLGYVDMFCLSPKGNAYIIQLKSHRGEVYRNDNNIYWKFENKTYRFKRDILGLAMKKALYLKKLKNLNRVTPIIAFSGVNLNIEKEKVRGVYVIEKSEIKEFLSSLNSNHEE